MEDLLTLVFVFDECILPDVDEHSSASLHALAFAALEVLHEAQNALGVLELRMEVSILLTFEV